MGDHTEAFQLDYDPSLLSYAQLLDLFWAVHNPARRSHSVQYGAAVFCEGAEQHRLALESQAQVAKRTGAEIHTRVAPLTRFYRAEDYHQKYQLRRREDFMKEFGPAYGPSELTDSTVAARLNGYLSGQGSAEQLERELASFGLSSAGSERLTTVVRTASRAGNR